MTTRPSVLTFEQRDERQRPVRSHEADTPTTGLLLRFTPAADRPQRLALRTTDAHPAMLRADEVPVLIAALRDDRRQAQAIREAIAEYRNVMRRHPRDRDLRARALQHLRNVTYRHG